MVRPKRLRRSWVTSLNPDPAPLFSLTNLASPGSVPLQSQLSKVDLQSQRIMTEHVNFRIVCDRWIDQTHEQSVTNRLTKYTNSLFLQIQGNGKKCFGGIQVDSNFSKVNLPLHRRWRTDRPISVWRGTWHPLLRTERVNFPELTVVNFPKLTLNFPKLTTASETWRTSTASRLADSPASVRMHIDF